LVGVLGDRARLAVEDVCVVKGPHDVSERWDIGGWEGNTLSTYRCRLQIELANGTLSTPFKIAVGG